MDCVCGGVDGRDDRLAVNEQLYRRLLAREETKGDLRWGDSDGQLGAAWGQLGSLWVG